MLLLVCMSTAGRGSAGSTERLRSQSRGVPSGQGSSWSFISVQARLQCGFRFGLQSAKRLAIPAILAAVEWRRGNLQMLASRRVTNRLGIRIF